MTPSKILLYFCFSFIGGIFINSVFRIPLFLILLISILGILLISVFWEYKNFVIIGFCILFFVLGIWHHRTALSKIENSPLQKFLGKEVTFIGLINEEPEIKERSIKFEVKINKIEEKILVTANRYPEYQYGDKLKITGKLAGPQEYQSFNYKNYLLKDRILAVMNFPEVELVEKNQGNFLKKILISFKQKLEESLNKTLSQPQSAILEALLFGKEENISKQWKEKLNLTGTRHIAAVSGMNITIISNLIFGFLLWLGLWRNQAFYFSTILIIFYILMIGAPASAIRAGIMGLLLLTAQHFGRFSTSSRAIVLAATLMLFQNPLILRWDIGFQLSFLATLGMINLQSILSEKLKKIPDVLQLRNNLSATLAAQIFVFPILIYNFGQISIISPLTNILILPLIPSLTILGFIFSFIGIFWQPLAQILSWPAWLGITYILKIVDFSSKISWASLIFKNIHWIFLIISYLILGIIVWRLQENQKLKFLKY
jgi:competence protein ComEC